MRVFSASDKGYKPDPDITEQEQWLQLLFDRLPMFTLIDIDENTDIQFSRHSFIIQITVLEFYLILTT